MQLSQQKLIDLSFLIIHLISLIPFSIPLTLKFEREKLMQKTGFTHEPKQPMQVWYGRWHGL